MASRLSGVAISGLNSGEAAKSVARASLGVDANSDALDSAVSPNRGVTGSPGGMTCDAIGVDVVCSTESERCEDT